MLPRTPGAVKCAMRSGLNKVPSACWLRSSCQYCQMGRLFSVSNASLSSLPLKNSGRLQVCLRYMCS
ncbi:Uncharacterised protein [Vibrio cholerae]|nr:Uncharacterised protein [Vibrio cholerae]